MVTTSWTHIIISSPLMTVFIHIHKRRIANYQTNTLMMQGCQITFSYQGKKVVAMAQNTIYKKLIFKKLNVMFIQRIRYIFSIDKSIPIYMLYL